MYYASLLRLKSLGIVTTVVLLYWVVSMALHNSINLPPDKLMMWLSAQELASYMASDKFISDAG